ncbi:MAG TPA: hypothetical protein VD968_12630 [Pyrinomonadaceae bacterium]|nr:hypothetical protein [Pyrinomonadaceae bacterium]
MAKKKDMAAKDKEPQVRGRPGPASATANETRRAGKRGGSAPSGRSPKVGKHETGRGGGGGLH